MERTALIEGPAEGESVPPPRARGPTRSRRFRVCFHFFSTFVCFGALGLLNTVHRKKKKQEKEMPDVR